MQDQREQTSKSRADVRSNRLLVHGSVEGEVTYDGIILAEIELDGCSRWRFSGRSVLDFRFPQEKTVENRSNTRTKMVDSEKQSSYPRMKCCARAAAFFEKFDEGLAGFWK